MKNFIRYIAILFVAGVVAASCSEHELSYDSTKVDPNAIQVRLMYDLPDIHSAALDLKLTKYNGVIASNVSTKLSEAIPNSTGKYNVVQGSPLKVELFRSGDTKIYDRQVALNSGKHTMFIYNLTQDPLVIADEPFPTPDPWADTCMYVNFVNLLYQPDLVTSFGTLTLQLRRDISAVQGTITYEDVNVATVNFGQNSGWVKVPLKRNRGTNRQPVEIWNGTESGFIIRLLDAGNNVVFEHVTSTTAATAASFAKGGCYYIHASGNGTNANSAEQKRVVYFKAR